MRIVLDARGYARHPVELAHSATEGWVLQRIAQALRPEHDCHILLNGGLETVVEGVSYWPETRHPEAADCFIGLGREKPRDVRAKRVIIAPESWSILPGVDMVAGPKDSRLVLWTAHPNRGLWHLQGIWPRVTAQMPEARLRITHDLQGYYDTMSWQHDFQGLASRDLMAWVRDDPTVAWGKAHRRHELAALQAQASILAYPADPILAHPYHRSYGVIEALGAGCAVLTTAEERLYDDFEGAAAFLPSPWDYEAWADVLVDWLKGGAAEWQVKGAAWALKHTWKRFSQEWRDLVEA